MRLLESRPLHQPSVSGVGTYSWRHTGKRNSPKDSSLGGESIDFGSKTLEFEELLQALQSCSVHGEAHRGDRPTPTVTSFSHSAFWQARGLPCEAGGSHGEGVGLELLE